MTTDFVAAHEAAMDAAYAKLQELAQEWRACGPDKAPSYLQRLELESDRYYLIYSQLADRLFGEL